MFCPNCGNNCGNANFCPNCGTNLKGVVISVSAANNTPDERTEMIRRYGQYMPNRIAAIKAFRTDTGMGLKEAKQAIDDLFGVDPAANNSFMMRAQKKAELNKSGQIYCPKCLSTSISADKKDFGIGKAVVGASIIGGIGLTAGNIGSRKIICTCLNCGYQWKAGKK